MLRSKNKILQDEYDFIFGIGAACSCSSTLRECGLQFESYPLDWLYGGDLKTRTELLLNHFKNFINKEDLTKIGERENSLPCDIYANTQNKIVFNHDFALHQDIDDTYPAVKEKYDRRIKRLYDRIQKAQKILIVYMQTPTVKPKIRKIKKQIKENLASIQAKYQDKEIKFLCLLHKKYFLPIRRTINLSPNSLLIVTDYRNKDKTTEPHVVNPEVLHDIFKNIRLNKKIIIQQEKKTWVMQ